MQDEDENQPLLHHHEDEDEENTENQAEADAFGVTVSHMMDLMDPKNPSLLLHLGGPDAICSALHVNPQHGLDSDDKDDLNRRRRVFGRNDLPQQTSKSFGQLLLAAYNDKTLSRCPTLARRP